MKHRQLGQRKEKKRVAATHQRCTQATRISKQDKPSFGKKLMVDFGNLESGKY